MLKGGFPIILDDGTHVGGVGVSGDSGGNDENCAKIASEVAKKLNLLECGGSDYHGDIKPNINLGYGYENTPIKVPYEFLNDMKEKHGQL